MKPWLFCILFIYFKLSETAKVYPIRFDAPIGWLLADLAFDGVCTKYEKLTIQKSEHSVFFKIENNFTIISASPLGILKGQKFLLNILAERKPYERILTIHVEIQNETSPEFLLPIYNITIDSNAATNFEILLPARIALKNETSNEIYFGPISYGNDLITFVNVKEYLKGSFAKLFLSRQPNKWETKKVIYIGAFDRKKFQKRVATTKLVINIKRISIPPPKFESDIYLIEVKSVQAHSTFLRVKAKTSRGTPFYRIDPESSKFDIAPIAGDIFSTSTLKNGIYEFFVIASDSLGQESKCKVKLIIGTNSQIKSSRKTRTINKRDRAEDIFMALKEDHKIGILPQQILLFADERIDGAPIVSEYLKVLKNGSIELIKEFNFEKQNEININIPIIGDFNRKFYFCYGNCFSL
uniref:Cadherin domain-containing protein n=1 Tax=Panagrolaimus sp. PS1159 TaxID=55785 RepID=A0AC35FWI2_9BILA